MEKLQNTEKWTRFILHETSSNRARSAPLYQVQPKSSEATRKAWKISNWLFIEHTELSTQINMYPYINRKRAVSNLCKFFLRRPMALFEPLLTWDAISVYKVSITVVTPNKGQLIFWENGSNKGKLGIPLFAIFEILSQIRDNFLIWSTHCRINSK